MNTRNVVGFESAANPSSSGWDAVRRFSKKVGPYLLVEAVMPGGTLVALALYLYRARRGV